MRDIEFEATVMGMGQLHLPDDIETGLVKTLREIHAFSQGFGSELKKINTDPKLTRVGKNDQIQKIGNQIIEKLEPYGKAYNEHCTQAEKVLIQGSNGNEPLTDLAKVLSFLKESEIRRQYAVEKMDFLELQSHANEPDFLESALKSPKLSVTDEQRTQLVRQKAKTTNPEGFKKLEQLVYCQKQVQGMIKSVAGELGEAGWRDPAHPLSEGLTGSVKNDDLKTKVKN